MTGVGEAGESGSMSRWLQENTMAVEKATGHLSGWVCFLWLRNGNMVSVCFLGACC